MALNRIMIWQREGLLSEEWGLEGVEEEEGIGMKEKRVRKKTVKMKERI